LYSILSVLAILFFGNMFSIINFHRLTYNLPKVKGDKPSVKYITNGYYFFTGESLKNTEKASGFSLLKVRSGVKIEFLQSTAALARTSRYKFSVAVSGIDGNIKYVTVPLTQTIFLPIKNDSEGIIAAALIKDGQPIATALPKNADLVPDFRFDTRKNIETDRNAVNNTVNDAVKEQPPFRFDPFGTTNPAYSWKACTSSVTLRKVLSSADVTLPVSVTESAEHGIIKYGHTLLGRYADEDSGRTFFILGVPTDSADLSCAYNYKYEAARFVAASELFGNYRYLGYHLYYIDEKSTALVKVVVR